MSQMTLPVKRSWGETQRRDAWWKTPLFVFVMLGAFLVYANIRVFEGDNYYSGHSMVETNRATNYLTPFYSPLVFEVESRAATPSGHAWLSAGRPAWLPVWISPAALILIFPAGFRFTCYYYRGAYYKAFWQDPPSCAVGEPRNEYRGEHKWPLLIQNIHRYFMYFAVAFLFILAFDAWHGFHFRRADGSWGWGIGVGSIVLLLNVVFLTGYTLGCHSFRHLVGGHRNAMSETTVRQKLWKCSTCLNEKHMAWAWTSLIWVAFSDVYVRLCATGTWTDLHIVF